MQLCDVVPVAWVIAIAKVDDHVGSHFVGIDEAGGGSGVVVFVDVAGEGVDVAGFQGTAKAQRLG